MLFVSTPSLVNYMYSKYYYIIIPLLLWSSGIFAQTEIAAQYDLEQIVVSATKETNEKKTLPGSISLVTPRMMEDWKIISIVDLSAMIPNFFVPNYGSRMSTPVYIRGIGERSTGQAVGLYVDNAPYLNKSVFNFDFLDVQRIELLRGPQGTLYGRNAMGGIINVTTWSPLEYEHAKVTLTAGNYDLFRTNASVSKKIGNKAGVSLSGYYDGNNGFFENQYDGKRADWLRSTGGRVRLNLELVDRWMLQLIANGDYADQRAFPYGKYSDGKIEKPDYDHAGRYTRKVAGSSVSIENRKDERIFTSSTGFQYFDDDMHMDLDYTPESVFTINQNQKERNWTQEFTVSNKLELFKWCAFKWSLGAFAFIRDLRTDVVTTMGQAGVRDILQPFLDAATANNPRAPSLVATDNEIPIPGIFKTPAYGLAFFYQYTYNFMLLKGLSYTLGVRLDYEKTKLDYNTQMTANIDAVMNGTVVGTRPAGTTLTGSGKMSFTEWLPKFALKYEFEDESYYYFSIAKGHKTGGYNIQMFADIVQDVVRKKYSSGNPDNPIPQESPDSILFQTSYRPEHSWNYELGFKGYLIENLLRAAAAVFYVDLDDVQITQFVESGQGRLLKNAGRAKSVGFDLELTAYPVKDMMLSLNYGYAHAVLKNYKTKEADYSGNFIPFAPQHTFSLVAGYNHGLSNKRIIDRFNISVQYNGAGKIYWTEANDVYQNFYGLLNLKTGVSKGIFGLNVWTRNSLNTDYATFLFKTGGQTLAQKGAPFQMGVDLTVSF